MAHPRVAVLMVNTNEGAFLERSLPDLRAQTRRPDRVILADNGSTDGSLEMVRERFPEVEVIELGRNVGFAAANNVAARAAEDCELIALLNADAFPAPGWLDALVRAADRHPGCAAFASLMLRANEPGLVDGAGDHYHVSGLAWQRHHLASAEEVAAARPSPDVFSACAGAALYRRGEFLAVGGFDEGFYISWEDVDLAFRLRLAGHGVRYEPEAVVRHVGSATMGALSDFTIYHNQRNMVWTWVRDMPWPLLLAYLPWHLAANVAVGWSLARRGHARVVMRAKRDALRGLPRVMRERTRLQRGRKASARELRRSMAKGREVTETLPSLAPLVGLVSRGA